MLTTLFLLGKSSQSKLRHYNVYEEVKKLLISSKNDRVHVSKDSGTFQCLVSAFHNYEVSLSISIEM